MGATGIEGVQYDHSKDKWEWENLAGNSDYSEVKEKLRKEIPTHHEPNGVTYVPPKPNRQKAKANSKK